MPPNGGAARLHGVHAAAILRRPRAAAGRAALPMIKRVQKFLDRLGPGLITGAADDDPSGIATYSQAGAQFGLGMLWSVFLTTPLMVGIQVVSARIGRVTGHGIAHNLRDHYPRPLMWFIVSLLLVANTLNVGAASQLYEAMFGVLAILMQLFIPYRYLAPVLKWLTLSLFAYVAVLLAVDIPWTELIVATLIPPLELTRDYLMLLVAVLGTTISPYLFFWQASQEVEEQRATDGDEPLRDSAKGARDQLRRIKIDTWLGMTFSNLIAFSIMLTTAVTLHSAGVTDIESSAQAAQALKPVAGQFAFVLFAAGIIGTGMLAIPVLAGSAAYAFAEAMKWPIGLSLEPMQAKGFYGIITLATVIGIGIDFAPIDPIKALVWSAMLNGVVAVPIMAVMMRMAVRPDIMGAFTITRKLKRLGWFATWVMGIAVVAMIGSLLIA